MFLAHAPVSYLANEVIQKKKISGLKNSQQMFVAVLSLIFGILPDFDFLIMMGLDRPSYTHHDCFTHTPIYWIGCWLLLLILSKIIYPHINTKSKQFLTKDLLNIILNSFLIAGLSHLVADLLVSNIMLLYPITDTPFTILKYVFEPSYFTGYFFSIYFAIEIVIIAIFFWFFSRKFLIKQKWDDVIAYCLITLSVFYLLFTVFMGFRTYNKSFLEDASRPYIDYDMDYDTLRDIEDWDVDNNGIDNILDADQALVVEKAKSIIDSHKLVVGKNQSLMDRIFLKYGALNSYKLVSQSFYESFSPMEPVLKDFYIKGLDKKKYTVTYNHQEVLKNYLDSKKLLIDLNMNSNPLLPQGKIFFLLNEEGEIMNMGITLNMNSVGIVLPGEKQIQRHTLYGILRFYGDSIATFQIAQ
ncbi:MAG: metal-dependent hydrolase [Candidatus Dojkabacteria bacterium]